VSGLNRTVRTSHTIADVFELHLKNYLVLGVYGTKCTRLSVPSSELGPPTPPTKEVSMSPLLDTKKGGGATLLRVRGWGDPSRTTG
jgi:hypothetical protein